MINNRLELLQIVDKLNGRQGIEKDYNKAEECQLSQAEGVWKKNSLLRINLVRSMV